MSDDGVDMGVIRHFQVRAGSYDQQTQWRMSLPLLECFAALIPEGEGPVVDLGCGTGIIGEVAAARGWHVTGVDLAPKMLEQARHRLNAIAIANVLCLPFPDGGFRGALMRQVFHYVDDYTACLEVARSVCDDGFFVVGDIVVGEDEQEWWTRLKALVQPLRCRVYTSQSHADLLRRGGWRIESRRTCIVRRIDPLEVFLQHVHDYPARVAEVEYLLQQAATGPNGIDLEVGEDEVAYNQCWQILRGRR
jgi:SAM-dependent methyltransferase